MAQHDMDSAELRDAYLEAMVDWDRKETDPCQRGTVGCCINHDKAVGDTDCETW